MKKGQKRRIWTKEQKLEIIGKHLKEHISVRALEKEYNADRSMICHWLKDYDKYGEAAFDAKSHKQGNRFAALHTSESLTENERLRLELVKLEIENERLKKRLHSERSWCKQGVRFFKRCEYEIIYSLKEKYSVKSLCEIMSVNRSGYYKWLSRKDKPNRYEQDRMLLTKLLLEQHTKHKSKGYHYLAKLVRNETGWIFSDNLVHKCCK